MQEEEIFCLHGVFKDNKLYGSDGVITPCITYESVRKKIENRLGYYNLKRVPQHNHLVIYQYILDEDFALTSNK